MIRPLDGLETTNLILRGSNKARLLSYLPLHFQFAFFLTPQAPELTQPHV